MPVAAAFGAAVVRTRHPIAGMCAGDNRGNVRTLQGSSRPQRVHGPSGRVCLPCHFWHRRQRPELNTSVQAPQARQAPCAAGTVRGAVRVLLSWTVCPCVSPFADSDRTISSTPPRGRCRFLTSWGSKDPARSRGIAISTGPDSVITVLDRCPLR